MMLKKVAFTFIIRAIVAVSNLALVILLSRYIGATGKGEASLIITSIAMIALFCNVIGGSTLVYFVPRHNVFQLFFLSNIWTIIVCVITFFIFKNSSLISESFVNHVVWLSLINAFLATNLTILLSKEKIFTFNIINLIQTSVNLISLFCMFKWLNNANVEAYIISLYASMLLCFMISTIAVFKYIKTVSFTNMNSLLRELAKIGFVNQAGHVMKFMSFRFNYYLLSIYSGDAILGIYSNGVSLVESVLIISNSFCTVLYPKVSNSTDINASRATTLQFIKINLLLSLACLIPMMILPSGFYVWLFGAEFTNVNYIICLLSPGIAFYSISLIIGHYFSGTGNYKIPTIANFIGLATTVIVSIFCIPKYGSFEASMISTVSYLTTTFTIVYFFLNQSKFKLHQLVPNRNDFISIFNELKLYIGKSK